MPYTSSDEDEQQALDRPQRRRRADTPRKYNLEARSDEFPGIPKVRRASLYKEQQDQQNQQGSQKREPAAKPKSQVPPFVPGHEADAIKRRNRDRFQAAPEEKIQQPKPYSNRRPYYSIQNQVEDTEGEGDLLDTEDGTTRRHNFVDTEAYAARRRHIIDTEARAARRYHPNTPDYNPPPPAHRLRPGHPPPSLYAQIFHLRHNRPLVIITIALCLLLIIPLLVNIARSQSTDTTVNTGFGNITPVPSGPHTTDPYQLIIAPQDTDHPAPPVIATSAYLLDADTGATLYAHNPFQHLPMLSTTKLMTALLASEHGTPNQPVVITDQIAHDVSQLSADSALFNFKKGEIYTLRDMLYALFLVSGNDAAIAIADTLGGNQVNFVAQMNERAQQLGLNDTHYVNPHGLLANGQYSSARDLAILGAHVMGIPLLHQISGTEIYHMPATTNHPDRIITNGNQFLWWYPGVDGGKTGFAPYDFIQMISCTRNGHHLIGVVMHTNNWWTDMRDLMNWGFNSFTWISPYDVDISHPPIPFDSDWNYFVSDKKENTIPMANGGRYYIYTGFSVSRPILSYFDQGGGLKKFGYPTGLVTAAGGSLIQQRFEHGTIQCDTSSQQCKTS